MEDMVPRHPSPTLLTTPKKVARPKGKWAIALALLFLVMVARNKEGWLANIARHDLRTWLTTSTKIPVILGASRGGKPAPVSAPTNFLPPLRGAKVIQRFGWTTTHRTATFHSTMVVAGRPDSTVISGLVGQVKSLGPHQVTLITEGHDWVTYQDLVSLSVRLGEHLGSESVVGHVGKSGHLGITITDRGLPVNPLASSFFGPRAFF